MFYRSVSHVLWLWVVTSGSRGAHISMRKRLPGIPARKLPWDILDSNHHWSPRRDDGCNLQTPSLHHHRRAATSHLLPYCWQESASWHVCWRCSSGKLHGNSSTVSSFRMEHESVTVSGVAMCGRIWHGCLTSSLWIDAGVLWWRPSITMMRTSGSILCGNMDGLRSGAERSAVWRRANISVRDPL